MRLRPYQQNLFDQITRSNTNDLVQLDTGAGKTPVFAKVAEHYKQAIIVCHRNILIKQASDKLAACKIEHRIMGSREVKKIAARNNFEKYGKHYINPRRSIVIVSIDTFNSHMKRSLHVDFTKECVILIDEAHHFADENKWDMLQKFVNGRTVGFTATPIRGDGSPLIKKYGGFFDRIIQADGYENNATEKLISEGYLSQYRAIHAHDYGQSDTILNKTIELSMSPLVAYKKYSNGKQTLLIESRIENANITLAEFKGSGVKADAIHSKLPQYEIERVIDAYSKKQINVLIAVDMISEGFDVPDSEVLILARIVKSFQLYRQLCGRVLRPAKGKTALIVDLNGTTVAKHGLPSDAVDWNEMQGKTKRQDLVICAGCGTFFKARHERCPACGEFHDTSRHTGYAGALKVLLFTANMVEKERKRYKQEKKEEANKIKFKTEYLEISPHFGQTIVSKRCNYFFKKIQEELKSELCPLEYNQFFKKNYLNFDSLKFYMNSITPEFDKYSKKQAIAFYEEHK